MLSGFGGGRKARKQRDIFSRRRKAALGSVSAAASTVRGIEALESRVMLASTPFYGHALALPGLWQAEAFDKAVYGRIFFGPRFYATFGHRASFLVKQKPPTRWLSRRLKGANV